MLVKILPLLAVFVLFACEGSDAWYLSHPERKDVPVNGRDISVVPRGKNRWDSFVLNNQGTSILALKKDQIAAIEQVSGCKVTAAEYWHNAGVLQTEVRCPKAGGSK